MLSLLVFSKCLPTELIIDFFRHRYINNIIFMNFFFIQFIKCDFLLIWNLFIFIVS